MTVKSSECESTHADSASVTLRRILLLGFTEEEAVGWYRNNVCRNNLARAAVASISGFALTVSTVLAKAILESLFVTSMFLQYFLFIIVGMLFAYAAHTLASSGSSIRLIIAYSSLMRKFAVVNRYGALSFSAAAVMICYWALPSSFDAGISNSLSQLMMRLSLICVGSLILAASKSANGHVLPVVSVAAGKIMGLFGALLIVSPIRLYGAYPVVQQVQAGIFMIAIMVVIDMVVLPFWLYRYFGTNNGRLT